MITYPLGRYLLPQRQKQCVLASRDSLIQLLGELSQTGTQQGSYVKRRRSETWILFWKPRTVNLLRRPG
jgi:hypothetical protein